MIVTQTLKVKIGGVQLKEKNKDCKFKVGDKVRFTEKAIKDGYFHSAIKTGDLATITAVANSNGGKEAFPTELRVVKKELSILQFINRDHASRSLEWFEHEKPKKKRKYFRIGDFVKFKDGVDISEVTQFSDIKQGAIGIVTRYTDAGLVGVDYFYGGDFSFDHVKPEALRLATKEERKAVRKHKVANIDYNDSVTEESEQDAEVPKTKIPPEFDVKVGDIVKVTQYYGGYPVGTIGQVDTIDEDIEGYHNHVIVRSTDGDYWECNVKLLYRPNTSS